MSSWSFTIQHISGANMNDNQNRSALACLFAEKLVQLLETGIARRGLTTTCSIDGPEGSAYCRVARRLLDNDDRLVLFIARVEVDPAFQRRGILTDMRRQAELTAALYDTGVLFENVQNRHLELSLMRHAYRTLPYSVPPCLYKTATMLRQEYTPMRRKFLGLQSPSAS